MQSDISDAFRRISYLNWWHHLKFSPVFTCYQGWKGVLWVRNDQHASALILPHERGASDTAVKVISKSSRASFKMKKRGMKRLNIFLVVVLSFVFMKMGYSQSQDILILTRTGNYMPYQQEVGHVFSGIYIDVIQAVAKKMGVDIKIKAMPLKRAKMMIKKGKATAFFPAFEDSPMTEYLYFSEEPLALEEISLFAPKKNMIHFDGDLLSIASFRVGQVLGTSYGEEWNSMRFKKRSTNVSLEGLLRQLKANRVDLLIGTKYIVEHVAKRIQIQDDVIALEPSLIVTSSYLAFTKAKGIAYRKLADEFDIALREIKGSSQYIDIINQYIPHEK